MSKIQIVTVFDDEENLLKGIHAAKEQNLVIDEVYTPYPVLEAIEAMGKKSRFTFAAFLYGLFAVIAVLSFLYYTSVIDWPINYGGKPTNSFPSFIIITLVLTILTVTLLTLFTFSFRARIYPGKKYYLPDARATDDKFIMVLDKENAGKQVAEIESLLKTNGASEVYEREVKYTFF